MILEIIYEAKCKHCKFFKYSSVLRKNGTISKKHKAFCTNPKSDRLGQVETLKSKACNKLEL